MRSGFFGCKIWPRSSRSIGSSRWESKSRETAPGFFYSKTNAAVLSGDDDRDPGSRGDGGSVVERIGFFQPGHVQYIPVADRGDLALEPDYLPAHPALLKINRSVMETINPETRDPALRGEIAGDLFY
ncbi:MAG TPA: hypothetical protein VF208_06425, partial [Candidatus Binatia bacterium]